MLTNARTSIWEADPQCLPITTRAIGCDFHPGSFSPQIDHAKIGESCGIALLRYQGLVVYSAGDWESPAEGPQSHRQLLNWATNLPILREWFPCIHQKSYGHFLPAGFPVLLN